MKLLDWYILKRYLLTFIVMLLLFIPIGITVNLAEKIGKIIENEAPFLEVVFYYYNFTIYFANLLFPLFLFLAVIWFTSKLANNTEIVAILSSGVSFYRFLRPYFIGAVLVAGFALYLGMYLAPKASKDFNQFVYKYLKKGRQDRDVQNMYRQLNENDYIYVSQFDTKKKEGKNFTYEHFEGNTLKYKILANTITYSEQDSLYKLKKYVKRTVKNNHDILDVQKIKDTLFSFDLEDLTPVEYIAETLNYKQLNNFIAKEKKRGSTNINRYMVVKYKKWSLPTSIFILTIIAVAVSSVKRRGGMGVNLAFGISLAMVFVFFDKILGVMAEKSDFSPLIAVWFPNLLFGILSIFMLYRAKR